MKRLPIKIAAILAFVIGAMAVFAGGRVLIGNDPGYYVIDWVPVYNFTAGLISASVTAFLLWKHHRFAMAAAIATLASHSLVMAILLGFYRDTVALESITAMTTRIIVWLVILGLMILPSYALARGRTARSGEQG